MLEVQSLTVRAGTFVVRDVSIRVAAASCHVILGATGSGKTLFLESLIGLRQPVKGVIRIDGVDVTHTPVEQRGIGYVPQDLALFPHMTAKENILYAQRVRKRARHDDGLFSSLVDSLGIHHILERGVAHLSGGERQRVALARAIFSGSRVLILDEPLSSLHEGLRRELWFTLKDLAKTYRLALLMVTHDLDEAFFLGDDITILLEGKVRQQAKPADLLSHPGTLEVAVFLGIRNLFSMDSISEGADSVIGRCDALGGDLHAPFHAYRKMTSESKERPDKWLAGIHSKDVVVYGTTVPRSAANVFSGAIKAIYQGRNAAQVILQADRGSGAVECSFPLHDTAVLDGGVGRIVHFGLPPDKLFLVKDE